MLKVALSKVVLVGMISLVMQIQKYADLLDRKFSYRH